MLRRPVCSIGGFSFFSVQVARAGYIYNLGGRVRNAETGYCNGVGVDFRIEKPKFAPALLCYSVICFDIRHAPALTRTIIPPFATSFSTRQGMMQNVGKGNGEAGSFKP